ncbi:MAG: glycosyltransferase, partial [Thermoleophilia bacterium]|nr:glycosyltransferase [Thermoleophilia bacterium]
MEVLIVTPFFPYEPGRPYAGIFVGDQVLSLRQLGTRPRVVTFVPWTPWPTPIARERWRVFSRIPRQYSWKDIAVEARRYPVLPHNMGLGIASWAMERVLFQHCVRSQPDLIHAHFAYPTGLAAVRAGARHGVPVVLTVHGSDIHKLPSLSRRCKKG